ncbi:MAG TPA: cobalamin-dependent protein [Longimicrobiales bacterium]
MKPQTRSPAALRRHPIAVVAARTGLSADVLRVWERRYAAVQPARSPEGQRLYSDADVDRLQMLRLAAASGRSIGRVVRLSNAELARLIQEDTAAQADQPGRAEAWIEAIVQEALARTRALDAAGLGALLRRAASLLGVPAFLEEVAAALLRRVGEEWHDGRLSPAQEHVASSVVQQIMIAAMHDVAPAAGGPCVVMATPAGERHATGAALVGAWAAAEGWTVIYLGADLPAQDIAASAMAAGAELVALSIVYVEDRNRLLRELRTLRARLPAGTAVITGGAGARSLQARIEKLGARVCTTLAEFSASAVTVGTAE